MQGHPPFKCAVMVGGARPGASVAEPVMARSGRMQTPSMHIIGDADYVKLVCPTLTMVPPARQQNELCCLICCYSW